MNFPIRKEVPLKEVPLREPLREGCIFIFICLQVFSDFFIFDPLFF